LDFLEDLGKKVRAGSLCGLGQTAPNPVLATLRYFRNEYLEHVRERRCPALACPALVDVKIDPEKCVRCKLCVKTCPANAISGDGVLTVDNTKCVRCNSCIEVCPKKAICRVKRGE
jgi:ferredoxin